MLTQKSNDAGDHYTNLQNKPHPNYMHDFHGGKRMMQHSDSANEASKRASCGGRYAYTR